MEKQYKNSALRSNYKVYKLIEEEMLIYETTRISVHDTIRSGIFKRMRF